MGDPITERKGASGCGLCPPAGKEIQYGHTYGNAVGNLIQNDSPFVIYHIARQFNAPVHRPRVHDAEIGMTFHMFQGNTEPLMVFPYPGEKHGSLPFKLYA